MRAKIPELSKITDDLQVVKGGVETLAYLALQIVKSREKPVIMRALASAVMIIFKDSVNYTGSPQVPSELTGLEVILEEDVDRNQALKTNFDGAEPVTIKEIDALLECDSDELGAYFGVLCLAAVKTLTEKNRAAFNENRAAAVAAVTIGKPMIFVTDSVYLADAVLQKVNASAQSWLPIRSHIMSRAAGKMGNVSMGITLSFSTMFLLISDQGMSGLRIVKEAMIKYKWLQTTFPALKPEMEAANRAFLAINKAVPADRPFLKAIHGSFFVPVNVRDIDNLVGVCKHVLKLTVPSYANYGGGSLTDTQESVLNNLMKSHGLIADAGADTVQRE